MPLLSGMRVLSYPSSRHFKTGIPRALSHARQSAAACPAPDVGVPRCARKVFICDLPRLSMELLFGLIRQQAVA